MMKKRFLIITLILALLGTPVLVLASDISNALYYGVIQISNNSTATTNVATTANIGTTNLIAGGYLNASANNCVIRTSSGADVPFMPGYTSDNYPWCIWVPSIGDNSYQSDILYTAESTGGEIRYFPGAGGMTTPDNDATLELGDNFTVEQKGWVDTTSVNISADNLVYKEEAFVTYVSGAENITSAILDWASPTSAAGAAWTNHANTYDENTATYAFDDTAFGNWSGDITISIAAVQCDRFRYWVSRESPSIDEIDVDVYYSGAWHDIYEGGTFVVDDWETREIGSIEAVTAIKFRFYNDSIGTDHEARVNEVDFLSWSTVSVTATGVSSGEYTVTTKQGNDLASWWDSDWGARKKLTFDNSGSTENLTNVPVAVSLNSSNFDFSRAQADGDDIRFIDADDATELDYFAETWETGNETAIFWVEVPQIDLGSSTDFINLYYANDGAANNEDMNGVFTADVKLAGTYKDSTNILLTDATVNGNDGDFAGVGSPTWSRLAGSLQILDFDGTDDQVDCGAGASLDVGTGNFTVEAWVNLTATDDHFQVIQKGLGPGLQFTVRDTGVVRLLIDDNVDVANWSIASTVPVSAGVWSHIVGVADRNTYLAVYVDTVEAKDETPSHLGSLNNGDPLLIGERPDLAWDFDGGIAIVRMYNRTLSAEEIENHYLQEKHLFGIDDGFITFGDIEYSGLRIYIDDVLKDYTGGATVPNTTDNWTFIENYCMPYMEYQQILIGKESWISPTGFVDTNDGWIDLTEVDIYDNNLATYADAKNYGIDNLREYLELTLPAAIWCDTIRVYGEAFVAPITPTDMNMGIDLYYDGAWHNIFSGVIARNVWVEKSNPDGVKLVSAARIIPNTIDNEHQVAEFEFLDAGELRQHIVWEYDNVFTDLSENGNDATPTFRTASSDADVSAELISFQPVAEAKAPDYVLGEAPDFIDPGIIGNVTGTFTTTPGAGTFPLAGVITAIANATATPPQLPLLIIAVFCILAASLSISATIRRYGSGSLIAKILVITAVMGIFIGVGNFAIDFWMLVVFLIIATSIAFMSKQLGWS